MSGGHRQPLSDQLDVPLRGRNAPRRLLLKGVQYIDASAKLYGINTSECTTSVILHDLNDRGSSKAAQRLRQRMMPAAFRQVQRKPKGLPYPSGKPRTSSKLLPIQTSLEMPPLNYAKYGIIRPPKQTQVLARAAYRFTAHRNFADRARGFWRISSAVAITGSSLVSAYTPARSPSLNAIFTRRSSPE